MQATYDCDALPIPSDVSDAAVKIAIEMLGDTFPTAPITLMVRRTNTLEAAYVCGFRDGMGKPAGRKIDNIIFLPDGMVAGKDVWAVTDGHKVVWSPGA